MNLLYFSFFFSLLVISASAAPYIPSITKIFNVNDYGAVSDGRTDNAKAFQNAWADACAWDGLRPKLLIPKGKFLVGPLVFKGPCKGREMVVQVKGYVLSQADLNAYKTHDWISFRYINGLLLTGKGHFDGQGAYAWPLNNCLHKRRCKALPWSLNFSFVSNATIRGITSINNKNVHIQIFASSNINIHSIKLIAPENSPNTDGIHVGESKNINISQSIISTGDDCISIGPGTANLSISEVRCGPGHGISIGSLGGGKDEADVFGISVRNCTFSDTENGVRIKTWQESPTFSSAYDLVFEDLVMNNVDNPIVIDQKYCPHNLCSNMKAPSLVKISNVKFRNIRGETRTKTAINLVCSDRVPCEDIDLSNIDLKYSVVVDFVVASCVNVKGYSDLMPLESIRALAITIITWFRGPRVITVYLAVPFGKKIAGQRTPSAAPYIPSITKIFNVNDYGAVSDGRTDNAKAFQNAWADACAWDGLRPKLLIPKGKFLVGPLVFKGPCKGREMVVQVKGYVLSQADLNAYKTHDWISFRYINGLLLTGKGHFDGQGAYAWPLNNCLHKRRCKALPWSLNFSFVSKATIRGITSINSKNVHIQIFASNNINVHSIKLIAPENSPNTDGIHVGESKNINISQCIISTGDDCISIGPGTANLSISEVRCGPSHGISIGSLGGGKNEGDVVGISVRNCTFSDTENGVRIKTWQESPTFSSAYDLVFEDLVMNNVDNPIVIDQKYCPHNLCSNMKAPSLVKISNVKFRNIRGETRTKNAINLVCSDRVPCEDIELSNIDLKYSVVGDFAVASCVNEGWANSSIINKHMDMLSYQQMDCLGKLQDNPHDHFLKIIQRAKLKWLKHGEEDLNFLYAKIRSRQGTCKAVVNLLASTPNFNRNDVINSIIQHFQIYTILPHLASWGGGNKFFCAKFDIRKAFDFVSREFLIARMIQKGFPMVDFMPLTDSISKKLSGWKANLLSFDGQLQFLKYTILNSIAYWLHSAILPKTVIKFFKRVSSKFLFFGDSIAGKKLHMVSWDTVCKPKLNGGLGLPFYLLFNTLSIVLLSSECTSWTPLFPIGFPEDMYPLGVLPLLLPNTFGNLYVVAGLSQTLYLPIRVTLSLLSPFWRALNLVCCEGTKKKVLVQYLACYHWGLKLAEALLKRNIQVPLLCNLCNEAPDSVAHLFFECPYSFAILTDLMPCSTGLLFRPNILQLLEWIDDIHGTQEMVKILFFAYIMNNRRFGNEVSSSITTSLSIKKLIAPENSPNTDEIHVGESKSISISQSIISTDDDCISIGPGTANMSIAEVRCGPGHGISIGSLGGGKDEADVFGISVRNCTFSDTENGVRIKTWQESPTFSSAYDLVFEDLVINNVDNPIAPSLVKISNVKFRNIRGETRTKTAINLVCSDRVPCEDIELSNIDLKYSVVGDFVVASCVNVKGYSVGLMIPPSCI
ncbi:hypothetical protein M5K25_001509 [Dendrobium thyrsiflorum]|uniref:Exopolygalacturonase n=1 Tax=Dendrobium thyrsiflorum TaxID=117978 RepID=A0ABD0VQM8_DENTH